MRILNWTLFTFSAWKVREIERERIKEKRKADGRAVECTHFILPCPSSSPSPPQPLFCLHSQLHWNWMHVSPCFRPHYKLFGNFPLHSIISTNEKWVFEKELTHTPTPLYIHNFLYVYITTVAYTMSLGISILAKKKPFEHFKYNIFARLLVL